MFTDLANFWGDVHRFGEVEHVDADVPLAPSRGRALGHVGFEIDDLEQFTESLRARGVAFDVEYRVIESIGVPLAFFTDASGTYWELTEGLDEWARQGGR